MLTLDPATLAALRAVATDEEQAVLLALYQRVSEGKPVEQRTQKLRLSAGVIARLKQQTDRREI
jgi:hypothetical protein